MKRVNSFSLVLILTISGLILFLPNDVSAQRKTSRVKVGGKVCGDPQVKCPRGKSYFKSHELAYEIPANPSVITDSEQFYAVILKSVRLDTDANCDNVFPESERLDIQKLFPRNKVFALRCSDAGDVFYTNVNPSLNFIAVFAGRTLPEAKRFMKTVIATGKFTGANLRKMQAGINGT